MIIGFAGIGSMGGPMAGHLLAAGHELRVLARHRASADALIAKGAVWADSARALAHGADLVCTCLPGPADITAIAHGADGLLAGLAAGSGWIDFSTNDPSLVKALASTCEKRGVTMLDAPVSGGPKGAASGRLAIWVGGAREGFDRYRPVLDLLGDQVRYLGASGNAAIAKLVHNCANYGIQMVLAEVFTLGVKAGVDPAVLFGAIRQGSLGRQRAVERLADQFLPGEFDTPAFTLALAHKDVSLATALGRDQGVPMRLANLTLAEMTEALNKGWGERDSRVAMLVQEQRAGVDIKVPREVIAAIIKAEPI